MDASTAVGIRRLFASAAACSMFAATLGPSASVRADTVHLELDDAMNTVVVRIDDARVHDAADLIQQLQEQLDDPDATGVNSTGGNPGSEPPCKKAEGDGNKVPQTASEAQEFAEQFADGISLGGFVDDGPGRRRMAVENAARLRTEYGALISLMAQTAAARSRGDTARADAYERVRSEHLANVRASIGSIHGMSGISGTDFLDGTRSIDDFVDTWNEVYGGYENRLDHHHLGAHRNLFDALMSAAADLYDAAREHGKKANQWDAAAASSDAAAQSSILPSSKSAHEKAAAEARKKAAEERKKEEAAKKKAEELRKRAEEEKKKAEEEKKKKAAKTKQKITDPNNTPPSLSEILWLTEDHPWLAGTPWDPTRRLVLVLSWGGDGLDPTNSRPGVEEPTGPTGMPELGPPDSLILVLDPGVVSSNGFPCLIIEQVLSTDPTIVPPELARPNEFVDEDGILGGAPPRGPNPLPVG